MAFDIAQYRIYAINPIDHDWDRMTAADEHDPELLAVLEKAKKTGVWEGDFQHRPRTILIPVLGYPNLISAFIWKQDNNGTTFIASPVELPWLGEE